MTYSTAFRFSSIFLAAIFLLPFIALAHETHVYEINGTEYRFVIGSQNEPVIVDDKTGLDLRIFKNEEPFVGAQDSLQVEMIAGNATKVENMEPVHGAEGEYKTTFIATVPTTLQYRIFGELDGVGFDQTYTCNPVGHPASEENTERIAVSDSVTQILSRGNFGCPQPKEAFGFPEPAASGIALTRDISDIKNTAQASANTGTEEEDENGSTMLVIAALILSLIALVLGAFANLHRKERSADLAQ